MARSAIIMFLLFFGPVPCAAAAEGLEYEDWMEYGAVYGVVKAVGRADNTITILEDAAEGREEAVVTYYLRPGAELEGVDFREEIEVGDVVDVEYYTTADNKRVIDFISVEKAEEKSEEDLFMED